MDATFGALLLGAVVVVVALWRKGDVRAGVKFVGGSFFFEAKDRKQQRSLKRPIPTETSE